MLLITGYHSQEVLVKWLQSEGKWYAFSQLGNAKRVTNSLSSQIQKIILLRKRKLRKFNHSHVAVKHLPLNSQTYQLSRIWTVNAFFIFLVAVPHSQSPVQFRTKNCDSEIHGHNFHRDNPYPANFLLIIHCHSILSSGTGPTRIVTASHQSYSLAWKWEIILRGGLVNSIILANTDAQHPTVDLGTAVVVYSKPAPMSLRLVMERLRPKRHAQRPQNFENCRSELWNTPTFKLQLLCRNKW